MRIPSVCWHDLSLSLFFFFCLCITLKPSSFLIATTPPPNTKQAHLPLHLNSTLFWKIESQVGCREMDKYKVVGEMKSIWLPETKHLFRYRIHLIIWYRLSYFWSRKQITKRGRCFSYSDSGGQLSSVFGSLLMHIFQPNSLYSIVLDVKSDSLTFWQQLGISTNISLNSESRRCKQNRSYFHVRSLEVC